MKKMVLGFLAVALISACGTQAYDGYRKLNKCGVDVAVGLHDDILSESLTDLSGSFTYSQATNSTTMTFTSKSDNSCSWQTVNNVVQ